MATVNYNIKGSFDKKPLQQAKSGFKELGNTVSKINTVVAGFAVAKVMSGLKSLYNGADEAFVKQNEALTKYNTAVTKAGLSINKLQAITDKVGKNNLFDGDSINNAAEFAVQMGLTEDQIDKVMTAATDLASSGVMPLDQAVKALSESYSGNVTKLKKIAPELDNLTDKQIKNGDAVKYIAEQYAGFSDAMANTFSGRNTQFNNSLDDLKAAIGSIPESLKFISEGKMLEPLNKVTEWIKNNRDYVINFFLQLPEVFQQVKTTLVDMVKTTVNKVPELFETIAKAFIDTWKNAVTTAWEVIKAAISGIATLLDFAIGNPFRSSKDFINTMLNNVIEGINNLPQKLPKWVKKLLGVDENTELITFRFKTDSNDNNKTWNETAEKIASSITSAANGFKSGIDKNKSIIDNLFTSLSDVYGDNITEFKTAFTKILEQDLPADLKAALEGTTFNATGTPAKTGNSTGTDKKNDITGALGEIGTLIKAYQDTGWGGVGTELLKMAISAISSLSETVNTALSSISSFLNDVIPPIAQILENVLMPVLTFVKQIGEIVGNLFKMLEPILSVLLGNLMKSVLTVIVTVLDLIYNCVVGIYNLFHWGNKWEYRSIADDVSDIWNSESTSSYGASSSSSSGSASYTAAKDIYLNLNFGLVYGDKTAIALAIRDELRDAEKLGY